MSIKRRKYSKEQKEEIVQKALSGKSVLELGKENNVSPGLINRQRIQYLNGELNGNNNQEIKKLQIQIGKVEQMIGKPCLVDTQCPRLTITALKMAIATRNTDNLIHHSDQGPVYL